MKGVPARSILAKLTRASIRLLPTLALLGSAATMMAQRSEVSAVRIVSVPAGRAVLVDEQRYIAPVTFVWPNGSKHTLRIEDQLDPANGIRYLATGWSTPAGGLEVVNGLVSITASPAITEYTATFSVQYRLRVVYFECAAAAVNGVCPPSISPGTVTAGGTTFTYSGEAYVSEGLQSVTARPNPGWVFLGWYDGPGVGAQAFLGSILVTGPASVYPRFAKARKVTIQSEPSGLRVLADRQPVTTPYRTEWGRGTVHHLGAVVDQLDRRGKLWIFDSWTHGGEDEQDYEVPEGESPITLTAKLVPGERVSFLTNPAGLKLSVDGVSNWPNYTFNWAVGSEHTVAAPAEQVDANGQTWIFDGWSNEGPAAQTVTVPAANGLGLRLTANFRPRAAVTITSATPGVVIRLDGEDCSLPCKFSREVGKQVHLAAPATLPVSDGTRYDFTRWSDGAGAERTLVTTADPLTLRVNYQLKHHLSLTLSHPEAATLETQPSSPDGYFPAGAEVMVNLKIRQGFKFLGWEGDASGALRELPVSMTAPQSIQAVFEPVPTLSAESVANAAGVTPVAGVAPGSVISIFGQNLAPDIIVGTEVPLAQSIGDVSVRVAGRTFPIPLMFVSPNQINAVLPFDIAEGVNRIYVKWTGKPEASTEFNVYRNAPGLFYNQVGEQPYGLFMHQDDSSINAESPARRGETVTLLATGFGPYKVNPPDGFPVDEAPNYVLADPVSVISGSTVLPVSYAGVAKGRSGVVALRLTIGNELASGLNEIKVQVNGQESNTVVLPVE